MASRKPLEPTPIRRARADRAALRLAEITTTLPDHDTAEREYARAREDLTDDELSSVVWVATAINAFNRVSILSRHPVRP